MAGTKQGSDGTGKEASISPGAWLFGIVRALVSLFLGIVPMLVLFGVERDQIVPDFLLSLVLIVIGLVVFWLRGKYRAWYGLVELGAALATMFIGIQSYRASGPNPATYLQILGGLYIMIRGLDNIKAAHPDRDWRLAFVTP